jgi:hypothetical protein
MRQNHIVQKKPSWDTQEEFRWEFSTSPYQTNELFIS